MDNTQTLITLAAAIGIVVGTWALVRILSSGLSQLRWKINRYRRMEEKIDKLDEHLRGKYWYDGPEDYSDDSIMGRLNKVEKLVKRRTTPAAKATVKKRTKR